MTAKNPAKKRIKTATISGKKEKTEVPVDPRHSWITITSVKNEDTTSVIVWCDGGFLGTGKDLEKASKKAYKRMISLLKQSFEESLKKLKEDKDA